MASTVLDRFKELMRRDETSAFCCDCARANPDYVCFHYGTLVCQDCASVHRDAKRRVKPLNSPDLSFEDLKRVEAVGNDRCNRKYLALWDSREFPLPTPGDKTKIQEFLWLKYEGSWVKKKEPKSASNPAPPAQAPYQPKELVAPPPQQNDSYDRHEPARHVQAVYYDEYASRGYDSRGRRTQGYDYGRGPSRGESNPGYQPSYNDPYGRPDLDRYRDAPDDPRRGSGPGRGMGGAPGGEWWSRPNDRAAAAPAYGSRSRQYEGQSREAAGPGGYDPRYDSGQGSRRRADDRYEDDRYYDSGDRDSRSGTSGRSRKNGESEKKKSGKKATKSKSSKHYESDSGSEDSEDARKSKKTKSKSKKGAQLIDTDFEEPSGKSKKSSKSKKGHSSSSEQAARAEPAAPPPPPALEADLIGLGPVEYQNPSQQAPGPAHPPAAVPLPPGVSVYGGMVAAPPGPGGYIGQPGGLVMGNMVMQPGHPAGTIQLPPGYVLAPGQPPPPVGQPAPPPSMAFQNMHLREQ